MQLWWVIANGFKPKDPSSLTPREVVDGQISATALNMLPLDVIKEYSDFVALFKIAKEICDCLDDMFQGDVSIQRSRLVLLKQEANYL